MGRIKLRFRGTRRKTDILVADGKFIRAVGTGRAKRFKRRK